MSIALQALYLVFKYNLVFMNVTLVGISWRDTLRYHCQKRRISSINLNLIDSSTVLSVSYLDYENYGLVQ